MLNLLTTQVGHLLVDVLEPLFYDAERSGGGAVDPARTRISIQVHVERRSLHRRLMDAIYGDTPFALLRLFTRHPIHTKDALDGLPGRLCLPSAAVELDITDAYYARGHDAREANRTAAAPDPSEVRRYRRFRQFLRDGLRHDVTRPPKTVVFVERKGQRELLNGDALKDATVKAITSQLHASTPKRGPPGDSERPCVSLSSDSLSVATSVLHVTKSFKDTARFDKAFNEIKPKITADGIYKEPSRFVYGEVMNTSDDFIKAGSVVDLKA